LPPLHAVQLQVVPADPLDTHSIAVKGRALEYERGGDKRIHPAESATCQHPSQRIQVIGNNLSPPPSRGRSASMMFLCDACDAMRACCLEDSPRNIPRFAAGGASVCSSSCGMLAGPWAGTGAGAYAKVGGI